MRRKLGYLFLIMFVVAAASAAFSYAFQHIYSPQAVPHDTSGKNDSEGEEEFLVLASFYPVYVIAQNLVEGVPGVQVQNLTDNQTGCLHDYQLTTGDRKLLSEADVLLMNGGGMESFFENVAAELPQLPVISAVDGILMLPETGGNISNEHNHLEEKELEGHSHGEYNAHVWLDPKRYEKEVQNLADGLIELNPENQEYYRKNRDTYIEEIRQVKAEYEEAFLKEESQKIVIFHEAFGYLAEWLPFEVVHTVAVEGEESALSAGELAEVIEEIRQENIELLLAEKQEGENVADSIAREAGVDILKLDPLVTGSGEKDSWLTGMRQNLEVLKEGKD